MGYTELFGCKSHVTAIRIGEISFVVRKAVSRCNTVPHSAIGIITCRSFNSLEACSDTVISLHIFKSICVHRTYTLTIYKYIINLESTYCGNSKSQSLAGFNDIFPGRCDCSPGLCSCCNSIQQRCDNIVCDLSMTYCRWMRINDICLNIGNIHIHITFLLAKVFSKFIHLVCWYLNYFADI